MRTVIYPGSFDPITNGHLDVIARASKLFGRVIVAVADNETKHALFSVGDRKQMVARAVKRFSNVRAESFSGLLVDYAREQRATVIIRGLRAVSDFEFEFQLALTNRSLAGELETIFLMPRDTYTFLSSRLVKEVARLGGDVRAFVPSHVRTALKKQYRK